MRSKAHDSNGVVQLSPGLGEQIRLNAEVLSRIPEDRKWGLVGIKKTPKLATVEPSAVAFGAAFNRGVSVGLAIGPNKLGSMFRTGPDGGVDRGSELALSQERKARAGD